MLYISQELAQAIHDYLMTRPMREVEHLVIGIRNAEHAGGKNEGNAN